MFIDYVKVGKERKQTKAEKIQITETRTVRLIEDSVPSNSELITAPRMNGDCRRRKKRLQRKLVKSDRTKYYLLRITKFRKMIIPRGHTFVSLYYIDKVEENIHDMLYSSTIK